jgi:uncharacterized protein involved in exopolysaccharide biosynthesis
MNERQSPEDMQSDDKVVYVVTPDGRSGGELDLIDLSEILWRGRMLVILVTALVAVISIAYSLLATEWYRADVLLIQNEDNAGQSLARQFGGLSNLVGLAGLNAGSADSTEALAVLKSRDFARSFISDRELLPVLLYNEWDDDAGAWKAANPEDQPDIRDAVEYFDENVRSVTRDARTKLVTLSIRWTDPELAAEWATDLVARLNETMRLRALRDAERNVAYLEEQLTQTNIATLRDSIGNLLETELQKLMLAKGNDQFAYRVVDPAEVPKLRDWPRRSLIVVIATSLGGILGLLIVLIRHAFARRGDTEKAG